MVLFYLNICESESESESVSGRIFVCLVVRTKSHRSKSGRLVAPAQALPDHPLSENSVVSILTLKNDNHRLYGITRSFESRRLLKALGAAIFSKYYLHTMGT